MSRRGSAARLVSRLSLSDPLCRRLAEVWQPQSIAARITDDAVLARSLAK